MKVRINTDLENNWAFFNLALINTDTGTAYDFSRQVSYYHGRDGGENWSAANTGLGGTPAYIYALAMTPGRRLIAATNIGLYMMSFAPAPAVSSVSPNSGNVGGGSPVTITGTGFQTGATVTFDGTAATGVTVVNDTTITATTPAHSAGTVAVVVSNPDFQSGSLAGSFTYTNAPDIPTGVAATAHRGWIVVVTGNSIAYAGPAANAPRPASARYIDLPGMTLLPGLIDAHVHFFLHPYNEASWDDQVLKESLALRTARATNHARNTLFAGFTTVRDLGTEGAGYADVGLKQAINQKIIPGPRMLVTTRAIVATGSYGPRGDERKNRAVKYMANVEGIVGGGGYCAWPLTRCAGSS